MNREPSPTWISVCKWVVVLPVVLAAAYFGSYWWLWHTKSGYPVHEWMFVGGGSRSAPRMVQKAYEGFYRPAQRAERAWRIASFGRSLNGTWTTEDGTVRMRFDGAHVVDLRGLADPAIPDGAEFSTTGLCGPSLYLRDSKGSTTAYLIVPPESLGREACIVRISSTRGHGPRALELHRVALAHDERELSKRSVDAAEVARH